DEGFVCVHTFLRWRDRLPQSVGQAGDPPLQQRGVELLLAAEVVVDGALGDPSLFGDLVDSGGVVTLLGDQGQCGVEQQLACGAPGCRSVASVGWSLRAHPSRGCACGAHPPPFCGQVPRRGAERRPGWFRAAIVHRKMCLVRVSAPDGECSSPTYACARPWSRSTPEGRSTTAT